MMEIKSVPSQNIMQQVTSCKRAKDESHIESGHFLKTLSLVTFPLCVMRYGLYCIQEKSRGHQANVPHD